MLSILLGIALIGHGLAHLSGLFAPTIRNLQGYSNSPWLYSEKITFTSPLGRAFGIVWLGATVCLVLAGISLVFRQGYWVQAAIAGSILSLFVVVTWWKAIPPGAKFGALFDFLLLIVLLTPLKHVLQGFLW